MDPAVPSRSMSGSELRRLLALRRRLRDAVVGTPRAVQRDVLRALEGARAVRQEGRAGPWTPPEMTGDELLREIKWRLDAAALGEVDAAALVLDRASRRLAERRRRQPARGRDDA
jgi:hypothetical protein